MCKVGVVIGKELLLYSFPNHPMRSARIESFWNLFKKEESRFIVKNPVMADEEILRLFHDPDYIEFVKKASELGFGYLDYGDTPSFKGVYEASCYVVGSSLLALNMVMKGEVEHGFNPMGGLHHARKDRAGGFCVFNDIGIVINYTRSFYNLKRILYVDIDAHHGDGVFYEYEDDPDLYIIDIHESGRNLYPGSGFEYEKGKGRALNTKINIEMNPYDGDDEFIKRFEEVMSFAEDSKPELILMQCGADGLKGDPITHLRYTPKAHAFTTKKLHALAHKHCKGKLVAFGGGGYNLDNVASAWMEVIRELASEY
ncbi:MAG: acetoin utilization protein AcuC [Nitrososphaerales archaeon]